MDRSTIVVVVIVVIAVIAVWDSFRRLRRGGRGPRVDYIPRSLRPAVNRLHDRRGWPRPFDEEGHRLRDQDEP